MSPDLKLVYRIVLPIVFLAELLALTGITRSPHDELMVRGLKDLGHVGIYALDFFLLYIFSRPPVAERYAVVVAGFLSALGAVVVLDQPWPSAQAWFWFFVVGACFGLPAIIALAWRALRGSGDRAIARDLLGACGLAVMVDPTLTSYLQLTAALHPATFDLALFRFDATLGFQASTALALIGEHFPLFSDFMVVVYLILLYGISALYGMQRAGSLRLPVNIIVFSVASAVIGTMLYHLYPVSGPKYAFGNAFPGFLPVPDVVSMAASVIPPAPRNGMPSMHFGWALALWLNAGFLAVAWARGLFALMLGFTVLATLALGEHYLVDLVVAVPLVVAVQALCTRGVPWSVPARRNAVLAGFAMTAGWIISLRYGMGLYVAVPGLSWVAVIATLFCSVSLYRPLAQASRAMMSDSGMARDQVLVGNPPSASRDVRLAAMLFVISGFAALAYQVLFSKVLALTFGSTSTATYTVLATYMGGMAIGAWLGGRIATARRHALRLYAGCELGIGLYCLATPAIFEIMQAAYIGMATGLPPDAGVLVLLRIALGGVVLLVPTVLMGMTLPVLARFLEGRTSSMGVSVAALYGANTAGAALGALAAGYLILPALGVFSSLLVAALMNFVVAGLAFRLGRTGGDASSSQQRPLAERAVADPDAIRTGMMALIILALGGMVTLALEVTYVHLLAVVAGNSTYAFSLMLFAFLLGLGAGAETIRHVLRQSVPLPMLLAWLQWGLAAVILGGTFIWSGLPDYFAAFENYPLTRGFGAREVVRGLVCCVAMFPPAFFIGAMYPVAMECIGKAHPGNPVRALGFAAALNTAGNIAGVLIAGFVFLPHLGALRSVQALAAVCFVLGACAMMLHRQGAAPGHLGVPGPRAAARWAPALLVAVLGAVQPASFDYSALASGANVYFVRQGWGRIIDHAESVDGGLTAVAQLDVPPTAAAHEKPLLTLLTNGKFQGNDAIDGEMQAQIGFALSPLLHTRERERALVIGFGTGVSARTLHAAGFRQLDVVDLSSDILRLAMRYFAGVNDRVLEKPGVNTYVTDGRNFLMLQNRTYDVISMEVSSIWFAGAASLYNREFYRLAKSRLSQRGMLQQWMQLHHLRPVDVLYILGSVRAEFRYVWLYLIGGQGMIIASNDPGARPSAETVAALDGAPGLQALLALVGGSVRPLLETRLLDAAATDAFLGAFGVPGSYWVSTDDNLFLEYSTPQGNALDSNASFQHNLDLLRSRGAGGTGAR